MEGTKQEYNVTCRVKKITKSWNHPTHKRLIESDMVLLIPLDSTQMMKFFAAWLPEDETESFELATYVGSPVYTPSRMAICRKNKDCDKHHLFVMSKAAEDELLNMDGKEVLVTIFSEDEDDKKMDDVRY